MFPCPTCGSRLSRTHAGGHFLSCERCRGCAVRISLLRKTAKEEFVEQLWSEARTARGEGKRSCPVCAKTMAGITVTPDDRVLAVEACRSCQLIWFDTQELQRMPPAEPPPELSPDARQATAKVEALLLTERARQVYAERKKEEEEAPKGAEWLALMMGLPVEYLDAPRKREPWLTIWIMAAIGLVSIFAFLDVGRAAQAFGFVPNQAFRYGGLTLLSSFFLHADVFHLIGNLYFLLVFGDNVEDLLGVPRYVFLLVAATVTGALSHALAYSSSALPLIGASGGISGVIAFYALAFPHARVGFFWAFPLYRWMRMSVSRALIIWLGLQVLGVLSAMVFRGAGGVAYLGHLGGALVGLVAWTLWKAR
ncbi:MAG: rhomboid family intramembrane serine protease [Terriglobales bacterium]